MGTESKAFCRSKKIAQIEDPESRRENHKLVVVNKADSVEKWGLKPN